MHSENKKAFLSLVKLGIGHVYQPQTEKVDWGTIKLLAEKHGLSAIVLDGIERLDMNALPLEMKLEWIGDVLQNYEGRYTRYKKAIGSLAGFYNLHGFKMMVLKGYACSLDWPKPEHRPCGDIDIWQFGQQKVADAALAGYTDIRIDRSHHHHTVFVWDGFTVENHYDFVNVHHSKSNAEIEKLFKRLGQDDCYSVVLNGEKLYMPSPNLHALFLLRHAMIEFAAVGINLRQVLDWAFFVEKHGKNVDWKWLQSALDEYYMRDFFNCINAICVEDFGFEASCFPYIQFNPFLKDRVLDDILDPKMPNDKPKRLIARLVWKCRRWKSNEWKHALCYKESMWNAFWSGVWGHLLKPASI